MDAVLLRQALWRLLGKKFSQAAEDRSPPSQLTEQPVLPRDLSARISLRSLLAPIKNLRHFSGGETIFKQASTPFEPDDHEFKPLSVEANRDESDREECAGAFTSESQQLIEAAVEQYASEHKSQSFGLDFQVEKAANAVHLRLTLKETYKLLADSPVACTARCSASRLREALAPSNHLEFSAFSDWARRTIRSLMHTMVDMVRL